MKRGIILTLFVLFSLSASIAQDKKKEKQAEITLTGEITDVKCYMNGMANDMGDDHKQCAIDCIKGGLPVGILEEKTQKLYVLVPSKGMKGANEELVKYASQKVKLTGNFVEKGGAKMFFYTKVEEGK